MNPYMKTLTIMLIVAVAGCKASTIDTNRSNLGEPASTTELDESINRPGKLVFQKHLAANWSVPLSGLLNLEHPRSQAAGLEDRDEAIQIYVYSIVHPQFGTYLIDSGVASSFDDDDAENPVSWLVESAMNMAVLDVIESTDQLQQKLGEIKGIFLTHIHLDHIMGLPDIENAAVYGGPGDAGLSTAKNMFTQGSTDSLLKNVSTLLEWEFDEQGIIDVFSDGSFYAIHSPGHTPGATAYLAMTTEGPQLMIGDATHTRWGWENSVEPGIFSEDIPLSQKSLHKLQVLAKSNSTIKVHPGHQALKH
jgi:N-acyl homoserine lactone hydrolase